MMDMSNVPFCVVDIGGTNCRFCLKEQTKIVPTNKIDQQSGEEKPSSKILKEETLKSQDYENLESIIQAFLSGIENKEKYPKVIVIALTGVRAGGEIFISLLKWPNVIISKFITHFAHPLGGPPPIVRIINDLEAKGYALKCLDLDKDVERFQGPVPVEECTAAIVGIGTGLGECIVGREGTREIVIPTEGGFADFPPTNPLEFEFMQFLQKKMCTESLPLQYTMSGPGLQNIYIFLNYKKTSEILDSPPSPEEIVQKALDGEDGLWRESVDMFVNIIGGECGNLAAKCLPYGGLFIIGSLAYAVKKFIIQSTGFKKRFVGKEKLEPYLSQIPVFIGEDAAGIIGAEEYAQSLMHNISDI